MFYDSAGIIALAIVMLAIAIIIYPTLMKRSNPTSSNKSVAHRIRK